MADCVRCGKPLADKDAQPTTHGDAHAKCPRGPHIKHLLHRGRYPKAATRG